MIYAEREYSDEEIEDMMPAEVRVTPLRASRNAVTPLHQPEDLLPDADTAATESYVGAVQRLHEDKSGYPRFRNLTSVHALTGSFAPQEVVMIGAGVGNGKSLLCQNLFDDLTTHDTPTLYIGTEQSVEALKIKHACLRSGVSPRLMLKPEDYDTKTPAYAEARQKVESQLMDLDSPTMRQFVFYATTDYVNRAELEKWITGGVRRYGLECVIIDHIDQVDHGPGANSVAELTATVQKVHELARTHYIPIIVASQIKRHSDPIKKHSPPEEADFAGSSGKERIASLMLGLWRPLRTDMGVDEIRELKKKASHGAVGQDRIYQPDTMGVRLLKDRLGSVPGKQVFLYVGRGGKLSDDPQTTEGVQR